MAGSRSMQAGWKSKGCHRAPSTPRSAEVSASEQLPIDEPRHERTTRSRRGPCAKRSSGESGRHVLRRVQRGMRL